MPESGPVIGSRRPWLAIVLSVALHVALGFMLTARASESEAPPGPPFVIDIEVAPVAPEAEVLPPEQPQQPVLDEDVVAITDPVETPVTEEHGDIVMDAGVIDAPPPEPIDAGQVIAKKPEKKQPHDAGVGDAGAAVASSGDAGASVPSQTFGDDGGVAVATGDNPVPVTAGTAANLLAYFPSGHIVTVLVRFDRLRGTEWAQVVQDVLAVMPDFTTLVADPKLIIADELDIAAISTPRPSDVGSSLVAVKAAITPGELRDFLDEPGAPVRWSRVTGGVLGTRKAGKRVTPGDKRVFLQPYDRWTVLAQKKDLDGMLDAVEGSLDDAKADPAKMPTWLSRLDDIEAESGIPDGPALMLTIAPRSKKWEVPDIGLGFTEVIAPERLTATVQVDDHGWVVKGNLKFATEADAIAFVEQAEAAQTTVLGSTIFRAALKRSNAYNAIKGLTLKRRDRRVSYATSISTADARVVSAMGTLLVIEYFHDLEEEAAGEK
jgi:hypothetical protein